MNTATILQMLDRGILPTAEEQAALGLPSNELARRWLSGAEAESLAAMKKEQEQWRSFFSRINKADRFNAFCTHGTDEEHALFEVAERHYPKVMQAHMLSKLRNALRSASASYIREVERNLEASLERCEMFSGKPEWWVSSARLQLPSGLLNGKGEVEPDPGELIVMSTACGNAEGVAVVHNGSAVKVTITGVVGSFNFDPTDQSVDFEPGARSVQRVMAYRRRLPSVIQLLTDVITLKEVRARQTEQAALSARREGYWTDGKPFVPFHHV